MPLLWFPPPRPIFGLFSILLFCVPFVLLFYVSCLQFFELMFPPLDYFPSRILNFECFSLYLVPTCIKLGASSINKRPLLGVVLLQRLQKKSVFSADCNAGGFAGLPYQGVQEHEKLGRAPNQNITDSSVLLMYPLDRWYPVLFVNLVNFQSSKMVTFSCSASIFISWWKSKYTKILLLPFQESKSSLRY